jgi:hypothetical protein
MTFIEVIFDGYGIKNEGSANVAVEGMKETEGKICSGDTDAIKKCEAKLLMGYVRSSSDQQAAKFMALHMDLLEKTSTDSTKARYKMFSTVLLGFPSWAKIIIGIIAIVVVVLGIIPFFVIVSKFSQNKVALGKFVAMIIFATLVFIAYCFLPV